jgi:hypothetical protein
MTLHKSHYYQSQKLTTREAVIQEGLNFLDGFHIESICHLWISYRIHMPFMYFKRWILLYRLLLSRRIIGLHLLRNDNVALLYGTLFCYLTLVIFFATY